jgi:sugar phosphate isomerase/epimerase
VPGRADNVYIFLKHLLKMASTESIYSGAQHWFDSSYGNSESYGDTFLDVGNKYPTGQFGFTTDPRSANQLQMVSGKLSTGAKTIEVQGIQLGQLDYIPKQQFKEINRLKKLVGTDLTFHGPIIEPTGITKQGWQESDRKQVEIQMSSAVTRSHDLDPKGNIVVTFHSSAVNIEPETEIVNEKGEKELKEFWVINEDTGEFRQVSKQINYLKGETKLDPDAIVERQNNESWFRELQHVNFNVNNGSGVIRRALEPSTEDTKLLKEIKAEGKILEYYSNPEKAQEAIKKLGPIGALVESKMTEVTHGDIYLREAYGEFQNLFNRAYKAAQMNEKEGDIKKLDALRDRLAPNIEAIEKDPSKVQLLARELTNGVNVLRSVETPQTLTPLRPWAVDKAATTFANVAFDAYKKFKNTAPIISIENPPVGTGLSRAEDLRDIVDDARKKFAKKAQEKLHLSKSEADRQAEKLLGVTWDVGHINMLRGRGFKEKHIVEETKKIAELVKHVHLSDNFGLEHTELPMGMGNVPTKKHMELIDKYNKQAKKIVETGGWFEHFKTTPMKETLEAFGSPVYGMDQGPYWNQIANASGGYSAGFGSINPQIHHSIYGAGFANIPVELGGQMAGQSRVSGAPIE